MLIESILGERSRTVARIKRENFHRGVSCIEPLDMTATAHKDTSSNKLHSVTNTEAPKKVSSEFGFEREKILSEKDGQSRAVSWKDRKVMEEETKNAMLRTRTVSVDRTSATKDDLKLRQLISKRRNSTQTDMAQHKANNVIPITQQNISKMREAEKDLRHASPKHHRPGLHRGSSCVAVGMHPLKTSERPPLSRGFSCQTAKSHPSITLTTETGHQHSKIDILQAVSEIHDNFKEKGDESITEEETEDEFHEHVPGGVTPATNRMSV